MGLTTTNVRRQRRKRWWMMKLATNMSWMKTENGNDSGKVVGNSVQSVDINNELSLQHVKFDQFKRQKSGSGNADGENFSQQEEEENVDGGEMHKKKKKKKQEVESLHDIHSTVKFGVREADGNHERF
ncbi:hypothetical protein JHK82_052538 [Glycine max]|nr:hypothetical protein JHK82_052538 [Glycine max]